jgi:cation diffusion facilitator CzcD-associated flavoprotein CzcO
VSRKYKVGEKVRFERRVVAARSKGEAGKWEVDVEGVGTGEEREKVHVNVCVNATGCLDNWKLPEIEGLDDFEGKVMHSACWDQSWRE